MSLSGRSSQALMPFPESPIGLSSASTLGFQSLPFSLAVLTQAHHQHPVHALSFLCNLKLFQIVGPQKNLL